MYDGDVQYPCPINVFLCPFVLGCEWSVVHTNETELKEKNTTVDFTSHTM